MPIANALKSPYDGTCPVCNLPYSHNDPVGYLGGRLVHPACREDEVFQDERSGDHDMSLCNDCGTTITWVVTEKGKKMPLDIEAGLEGARFRKERVDENGDKVVHFMKDAEMEANTKALYTTHFDTCPEKKRD